MRAKLNPFARLRRRVRVVLGPTLPVLVVGWLGAAGPCVGMAAAPADETHTPAAPHDASAAHGPAAAHGGAGHGGHGAAAPQPGEAASTGAAAGSPPAHGACPHCPGSAGGTPAAHAHCAALDDVSSSKREPLPAKLELKLAPPGLGVAASAPQRASGPVRRPDLYNRVFPPSVPLNLRHCVLII